MQTGWTNQTPHAQTPGGISTVCVPEVWGFAHSTTRRHEHGLSLYGTRDVRFDREGLVAVEMVRLNGLGRDYVHE